MSRQVRQRVTAIVLGGLIFGAPLLTNGTASAERIPEGGRQVTFSGGGMFGLSCRSEPDVESMVVPAESTIRVVNRTGYAAKLLLGEDTKGTLAENASTEVIFRRGTTAVLLKPNCAIADEPEPVLVTASPGTPASTLPDPMPSPSDDDDRAPTPMIASDPVRTTGSSAGSAQPGATVAERPSRVTPPVDRPGTRRPHDAGTSGTARAATTAEQAMPHGESPTRTKIRSKATTGTDGAAPAFAGMPPGNEKALVPGVPPLALEPVTVDAAPAAPTSPPTEAAAAEPVAALEPMSEGGPTGLLALIAAVCVAGVSVAAIRAIVSQRANRSRMA